MKNQKWLRIYSCRATAILLLPVAIFNIDPVQEDLIGFAIIPLLFSGDLKRLWERILSNERIRQLIERREFLGIDLRLLLLMGVIMFAIVIIIFETRAFWRSFCLKKLMKSGSNLAQKCHKDVTP